jgi:hypothetical protein
MTLSLQICPQAAYSQRRTPCIINTHIIIKMPDYNITWCWSKKRKMCLSWGNVVEAALSDMASCFWHISYYLFTFMLTPPLAHSFLEVEPALHVWGPSPFHSTSCDLSLRDVRRRCCLRVMLWQRLSALQLESTWASVPFRRWVMGTRASSTRGLIFLLS